MNTALITFDFNTSAIRVVEIDGDPWFLAADVCRALGYNVKSNGSVNTNNALRHLDADEVNTAQIKGVRGRHPKLVSESGFYKLLMRSDKPEAHPFQDWVTGVVLPTIRKDGGYIMCEEKAATGEMTDDELVRRAMEMLDRKINRLRAENTAVTHAIMN